MAHEPGPTEFAQGLHGAVDTLPMVDPLAAAQAEIARLRAALADSEERGQTLFRNAPCVMVITRFDDFTILDVNEAFETASGFAREVVLGRRATEFPWWPDPVARDELLRLLTREGRALGLETRFIGQDGGEIVTLLNAARVLLKGVSCLLWHTPDITARTRAERSRQASEQALRNSERLESLGVVAGGIAHDFNNLLVGILGNAEHLLSVTPEPSHYHAPLRSILVSAERAAEHTRELLDYAGRGLSKPFALDLRQLVAEVEELARPLASGGQRVLSVLPGEPVWAHVDRGQLTRMLLNLVKNGLEAMSLSPGVVTLTLGATASDQGTPQALLSVSDQGIGMDEATKARIFDPFYSTKQAGHGLGLASVQSVVQRHRGLLTLQSTVGRGTTFSVSLPTCPAPEAEGHSRAPSAEPERHGRVLVVDDEIIVRQTARCLLEDLGFFVDEAVNGEAAIAKLAAQPFDVILLDATMPGLDAHATLRGLRDLSPTMPILLCSGYSRNDFAEELDSDAHLDFLAKPYRVKDLSRMIERMIDSATS